MVRRTRTAALETRAQIMDAAEWCFRANGASGTTLDMIAETARCTRGAVYWHFREGTDILHAVLERGEWPLLDRLEAVARSRSDVLVALRDCLAHCLCEIQTNMHIRHSLEILIYRCDFAGDREQLLALQRTKLARLEELLQRIVKRAQRRGEIHKSLCCISVAKLIEYTLVGAIRVHLVQRIDSGLEHEVLSTLAIIFASITVNKSMPDVRS